MGLGINLGGQRRTVQGGQTHSCEGFSGKKKIKNSEVALFQSRADEMGKADGSDLKNVATAN